MVYDGKASQLIIVIWPRDSWRNVSNGKILSLHIRRRSREAGGEASVMYDKKYSMDSDYREYYR